MGSRCPTGSGVRASPALQPLALRGTTCPERPCARSRAPPVSALARWETCLPSARLPWAPWGARLPFPACSAAALCRGPASRLPDASWQGPVLAAPPRGRAAPFRRPRPGPGRSSEPASRRGRAGPRRGCRCWRTAPARQALLGQLWRHARGPGGGCLHGDGCKQRGRPGHGGASGCAGRVRAGPGAGCRCPGPAGSRAERFPSRGAGVPPRALSSRPPTAVLRVERGRQDAGHGTGLSGRVNNRGRRSGAALGTRHFWNKGNTHSQRGKELAEWLLRCLPGHC